MSLRLCAPALAIAVALAQPDPTRHQFCLAHVQRNLQEMAEYSGGGQTAYLGRRLVLLFKSVFRTQHSYEAEQLDEQLWLRRMQRLRRSIRVLLTKGCEVPARRYAGRCQHSKRR